MLAGSVHARKGLLVQQAGHTVAAGHLFESLHHNLVVVNGLVHTLVNGSKLMLGRSHLIVLCLGRHA